MQIIMKNLSELKPYSKNPRKNEKAIEPVAKSIKEFGFKVPVVIDCNGVIVAGHTRYAASKKLKLTEIPCIIANDLNEEQIKAFRLADNKVSELAEWDCNLLEVELDDITEIDMSSFGFPEISLDFSDILKEKKDDIPAPSCQHNVFENQERLQFPIVNKYGIPEMHKTEITGDKMLRFCDFNDVSKHEDYIAHFYYDDYKFISAWRDPDKYIEKLKQFKAVVSPDFSLYTDFPIALQILSCYRRQWVGAYWQYMGIDVIPDVVWGDKDSFDFCFDGIPKHSTVAVSSVGVKCNKDWNSKENCLFKAGYDEMMKRLEPTTILFYGDMIDGLEGNIIRIPSYYEQKRTLLNEMKRSKNGTRSK